MYYRRSAQQEHGAPCLLHDPVGVVAAALQQQGQPLAALLLRPREAKKDWLGRLLDLLLGWFTEYVRLISLHKGGPAKITSAMGDPDSPILTVTGWSAEGVDMLAMATKLGADRALDKAAMRTDLVSTVSGMLAAARR